MCLTSIFRFVALAHINVKDLTSESDLPLHLILFA